MTYRTSALSLLIALGAASGAFAQTGTDTVQRDVNQQSRIESGLQNGSLNTKEAGRLEKEQSRIDRLQAKDMKDGSLSPRERAQLRRAQNQASQDIKAAESNRIQGNPESKSSERMQADVQRNIDQEKRIEGGLQSGALTTREAGRLERGQAHVDRLEAAAARNGHVGAREQHRLQTAENRQSTDIFIDKHNAREAHHTK